ncbi:peptide ABC transporter substrate-binding protein [bacterium]|nr:peptide ABC transporter substrate-binding protein [bacterium]
MYRNLLIIVAGCSILLGIFFISFNGTARGRADYAWVNGAEPETLDVTFMTGQPEGEIAFAIFEGLTVYHPKTLEPMPGVAKSWEQKDLTFTFHLRPDAWWVKKGEIYTVDGMKQNVTAHDFVYAWQRQCWPETGSQYSFLLDYIVGIEEFKTATAEQWKQVIDRLAKEGKPAPSKLSELEEKIRKEVEEFRSRLWNDKVGIKTPDDLTLEVTLKSFVPYFIQLTNFYPLFPLPRQAIAQYGNQWTMPDNIVTNGPYMLEDWRFNSFIRLKKNPFYWETEKHTTARIAELKTIEKRSRSEENELKLLESLGSFEKRGLVTLDALAIEQEDIALNLYVNGDVDKIRRVIPQVVGEVLRENKLHPIPHLHHEVEPAIYYYDVNLELPVFKSPETGRKIRQALALAIDRKRLIREVSRAEQSPAYSMVADLMLGYNAEPRFGTGDLAKDIAEAKKLLEEVKAEGVTLPTLRILYNTLEAHKSIAAFIQDQWKQNLGIDAKLENQEWQVYLNSRRTGQFDLARAGWIPDYSDPNTFLELFTCDDLESDKNPARLDQPIIYNQQNHSKYHNPHYNRIVLQYSARMLDYLSTPEKRKQIIEDVKSWPAYQQAIEGKVRKTGTTSIADLEKNMDEFGKLTSPEEQLQKSLAIRMLLLEIAEQMLMWDVPVIPIYHYTSSELWPPELEGIASNEREVHPPKYLRWKGDKRPAGSRYDAFPRFWPKYVPKEKEVVTEK